MPARHRLHTKGSAGMILRLLIAAIITLAGTSGLPSEYIDSESVDLSHLQRDQDDELPTRVYFEETGQYLEDEMLEFWLEYGGVNVFGYPISAPSTSDGMILQYFERTVLEYDPDNSSEVQVQLRHLGAQAAGPSMFRSSAFEPGETTSDGAFEETGHAVGEHFQRYWERHGGIPIFGFPISAEITANGKTIQYFERAVLQYNPDKPRDWRISQPLLGLETAQAKNVDTSRQQRDNDVAVYSDGLFGQGGASSDEPVVYLTFDDGPSGTYTPEVLDLLYDYDAYGTFFVLGQAAEYYPDLIQRMVDDGHTVANHTWDHPQLAGKSFAEVEWQLKETTRAVGSAMAPCMRPPYGSMDSNTRTWSESLGYEVILWDVDPRDWERPGAGVIADRILGSVFPGAVVLLHDGGSERSQSVEALEIVLEELSGQGYRFEPMCR
ncbi:MAG: polysaccharide deacetylase family protein [Sphaerobacteraceae bacterium]|nr:MAG: polysaccharide deacetylase family protein [Sphaerobacteraceae bacterium]